MRLSSRDLERRVRSAARSEMRQDKAVWKDYQRHRPCWMKRIFGGDFRQVLPFLYVGFALVMAAASGRAFLLVLGVAIYASATTVFRGMMLRSGALQGYDRAVLVHLPISDESFLTHEVEQSIWSWSRAAVVFFLAYSAALISSGHSLDQLAFAAIAALLQAACGLCLAMLLIAFAPKVLRAGVSTVLFVLIFVVFWLPGPAGRLLWPAVLLTPGGWISQAFAGATGIADGNRLWFISAFVMTASLPIAYGLFRQRLLKELGAQTLDDLAKVGALESSSEGEPEQQPGHVKPDSADSDVWKGQFLEGARWARSGWLEQLAVRFFDRRQIIVAEFMLGDQLGAWSKRWRTAALITVVGTALTAVVQVGPTWVLFLPLLASAMWGAPLFGGFWWGFFGAPTSGYLTPAYGAFPMGYIEISKVIWKANALRVLAWSPLAAIYITALSVRLGYSPTYGLTIALEIILLVLAVQPAMIAGHFSVGTNDTKQLNWKTFLFFVIAIVFFVILVVSALLLLEADAALGKGVGTIGMFMSPAAAWWGYKLLFNYGETDLLSKPE